MDSDDISNSLPALADQQSLDEPVHETQNSQDDTSDAASSAQNHRTSDRDSITPTEVRSSPPQLGSMGPPPVPTSKIKRRLGNQSTAREFLDDEKHSQEKENQLHQNYPPNGTPDPPPPENLRSESHPAPDSLENPDSIDLGDTLGQFDWTDIQVRYHAKIAELNEQEHAISAEYSRLCDYFGVWAQAGTAHEVSRSHKRLKTQIAFVQNEEVQLEQRRQHYVRVIDAFRNALQLLDT